MTEQTTSLSDGDLPPQLERVHLDTLGVHIPSLSVQEAAERLGVTPKTIRRRIKQGALYSFKMPTSQGYEWRVQLDIQDGQVDTHATLLDSQLPTQAENKGVHIPTQQPTAPELLKALDMIEALHQQNNELTAAATHWQARATEAERRAQYAEEQVKLLMAPKDEPTPEPAAEPVGVSWWRRWWSS